MLFAAWWRGRRWGKPVDLGIFSGSYLLGKIHENYTISTNKIISLNTRIEVQARKWHHPENQALTNAAFPGRLA